MSHKPPNQDNNSRNEYIPSYISKAPFYAEGFSDGDYLEHQRLHATPKDTLDKAKWYERGQKAGPAATKFRKGACENCGAMTHKTKECLERPRKHGAKWTGRDIKADELLADVKLGWDAKRDRWNGYDSREYSAVVKEYEDLEKLRQDAASASGGRKTITENGDGGLGDGQDAPEAGEENSEAKYAEETDMGRSQPTSTRQLRLREDTAKYLLNLDLDSARYDPKTRSMDTTAQTLSNNPGESVADDGFVRPTGTSDDAAAFERAQRYAWEAQEASAAAAQSAQKLHLQANPTEGEFLIKKRNEEMANKKAAERKALIDKYGEQAHLPLENPNMSRAVQGSSSGNAASKSKAIISSESYAEYDKHGNPKLLQGQSRSVARSKYAEDILTNNHIRVFGSWWSYFQWGYACCHSTVKNSYCTGEIGRSAIEESEGLRTGQGLLTGGEGSAQNDTGDDESAKLSNRIAHVDIDEADKLQQEQGDEDGVNRKERLNRDTRTNDDEANADIKAAGCSSKSQKRTFRDANSTADDDEIETYKRNRIAADDPMKSMGQVGNDGLMKLGS